MQKIKSFLDSEQGKNTFIILIVILVGFGAFQLGRISKQNDSGGIIVTYPPVLKAEGASVGSLTTGTEVQSYADTTSKTFGTTTTKPVSQGFVASKRGSKYYPPGCSAGKSLKQENRIFFATREEAEKAGYTPSSSCK